MGSKLDKYVTFSDPISVHFGSPSENVLKSDLKKSRIYHIWAYLIHFRAKPDSSSTTAMFANQSSTIDEQQTTSMSEVTVVIQPNYHINRSLFIIPLFML